MKNKFNPLMFQTVCAAFLITLVLFSPYLPVISLAQSDDAKDKRPTPAPNQTISQIIKPKVTYREQANYTEEARNKVAHGTVALSVVFRVDGNITDIKVVSGLPYGLTEAAIEAVRMVRFEPAMKNGQPVPVCGMLEYTFRLYGLNESSIREMLRNDFPVLSGESINVMATAIYKRGGRTTETAWRFGQQCLEEGAKKLSQPEQVELRDLMSEAIRSLDESDQQLYQALIEKSKTQLLRDYEEMQLTGRFFRGIAKLSSEKRSRAEALNNKAATLGIELL